MTTKADLVKTVADLRLRAAKGGEWRERCKALQRDLSAVQKAMADNANKSRRLSEMHAAEMQQMHDKHIAEMRILRAQLASEREEHEVELAGAKEVSSSLRKQLVRERKEHSGELDSVSKAPSQKVVNRVVEKRVIVPNTIRESELEALVKRLEKELRAANA